MIPVPARKLPAPVRAALSPVTARAPHPYDEHSHRAAHAGLGQQIPEGAAPRRELRKSGEAALSARPPMSTRSGGPTPTNGCGSLPALSGREPLSLAGGPTVGVTDAADGPCGAPEAAVRPCPSALGCSRLRARDHAAASRTATLELRIPRRFAWPCALSSAWP